MPPKDSRTKRFLAAYAKEVNNEIYRQNDKIDATIEQVAKETAGKMGNAISELG